MNWRALLWLAAAVALGGGASAAPSQPPLWASLPDPPRLPSPDQSGFAINHGVRLYYAVFNRGGGRPVLLLHGGLASSEAWGYEVPRLSKTHEVIVMDSRGQGRSGRSDETFTYQLLESDALAVMDALNIRRAAIVGASDGAVVGLLLAIDRPERVQALFAWGANFNTHAQRKTPPDPALAGVGAAYVARMEARYRELSPAPDGFADLRTRLGRMWSTEPDLKPAELGRISAPTVIADGQYEQFIDPDHTRSLARLIPRARLLIIPDVSHGGPEQNPSAFHRAVAKLLDRGDRSH